MASANVLELLDCSICMESMLPPIYQCQNGHTLCKTCKETIQKQQKDVCPTCRIPLGNIRCLALERMADNIKVPCQYTGCEDMFEYVLRLDHAKKCKFRPYSCPYVASACNVTGDVIEIIDHLKTDHKLDVLETNSIDVELENPNPSADDNKICKYSSALDIISYFTLNHLNTRLHPFTWRFCASWVKLRKLRNTPTIWKYVASGESKYGKAFREA